MKTPDECARASQDGQPIELNERRRAELINVNLEVNAAITPERKSDRRRFESGWSIRPGTGDCNDYAVSKRSELIRLGFPSSALLLAVVKTTDGQGHLVLLARTSEGDLVLDNLRPEIRPWLTTNYRWIQRQSETDPRFWVLIEPERFPSSMLVVAHLSGTPIK